jgi:hypothetical protein
MVATVKGKVVWGALLCSCNKPIEIQEAEILFGLLSDLNMKVICPSKMLFSPQLQGVSTQNTVLLKSLFMYIHNLKIEVSLFVRISYRENKNLTYNVSINESSGSLCLLPASCFSLQP